MKITGIIPARYQSSRFPGKPLADLMGKPLIWHVYQAALKFDRWDQLLIATDDDRIADVCEQLSMPCVMTSTEHKDCIDRAAEVAKILKWRKQEADRYVVIQGDEPLFDALILNVDMSPSVINFYTKMTSVEEVDDPDVVKVVVSKNLKAIYFSRFTIPYTASRTRKSKDCINIDKQIGLYVFSYESLQLFAGLGMSYLEGTEGIGLLRFIENDIDVYMRYAQYDSISVDTKKDLDKVARIMKGISQ